MLTTLKARENLQAARDVIRSARACDHAENAEEVKTVFSLALLRCEAEDQARELIALDGRRRELLASLRAYSRAEFDIDGARRRTHESRMVSAALVLGSQSVEAADDEAPAAAEQWKGRLAAIITEENGKEGDGHSD